MTAQSARKEGAPNATDNSFASDVLKLATGTGSAQLFGIIAAPVIARLFSPDALGDAAVFTSLTAVIGIVVCLRYDLAIMLPEEDSLAANVVALSFLFVLLVTSLTVPLILVGRGLLTRWIGADEFSNYMWLVPTAVLLGGIFLVSRTWSIRKKEFGALSVAQALITVVTALVQIAFGLLGFTSGRAFIIAGLIGLLAADVVLAVRCWRKSAALASAVSWHSVSYVRKRFVRFPKYSTSSAVLNTLSWQSPTFFLAAYFTPAVVGEYSLGNRLLRVPMNLVGINIASVYFQRASEAKQQGTLSQSVELSFKYLVALTLFPCMLLSLIGKDLFTIVFGPTWSEAGVYTQILSVWVCFWFISSPLSMILGVLEEQGLELKINILVLGSRVLSLLAGGVLGSPRLALGLFAATGVLVYGYYAIVILDKSQVSRRKMAGYFLSNLLIFIPAAVLIGTMKLLDSDSIVVLVVSAILVILYYSNLLRTDPVARDTCKHLVKRTLPAIYGSLC